MQFDPIAFYQIAEQIVEAERSEATLRTAVGRLYYAAFLKARQVLYRGASVPRHLIKKKGEHAVIVEGVKARNWSLGTQLDTLRELRVQADYFLVPSQEYWDWAANWTRAKAIADSLMPKLTSSFRG